MKQLTNLILSFITVSFFLISSSILGGQSITVSISLDGKTITSKYDTVCVGSYFQLSVLNSSPTSGANVAVYQWTNIDSSITSNTQYIVSNVIGRWVATIKYYNSTTALWTSASDTIYISNYPVIPFSFTTSNGQPITGTNITVCGADDSIFGASPGFKDYKWYKNSSTNLIDTTSILIITPQLLAGTEGTIVFFITAKDKNGCNVSTLENIRRDISVCVNVGADTTTCVGQPVTISSPCSSWGLIGYKYVWSTGAKTQTITVNKAGTYWLAITALSKCTFRDSMNIYQNPTPVISATKDTSICYGTSVQINANVVKGNGPFTYLWSPTGAGLNNVNVYNPVATPSGQGVYTYSISVKDPIGCTGDTSVHITVLSPNINPYFAINPGHDTLICYKSSIQLNPSIINAVYSSTYTWTWSTGLGLSNSNIKNPTVSSSSSGTQIYTVTATDARGCKKTDSVKVSMLTPLTLTTNFIDTTTCYNKSIQIIGSASGSYSSISGYTYFFSPSSNLLSGNSMSVLVNSKTSTYVVSAKDSLGCSNKVTVTVNGLQPFVHVTNSPDTSGYKGTPMVLNATTNPGSLVQWFDNKGNLVGTGNSYTITNSEQVYTIVTDTVHGCMATTDTITVTISDTNPYVLFVPNIFSPDASNSENKTLKVYGNQIQENNFSFRIYNQWGQLVYQTNSFVEANTNGWPGELNGSNQSNNVYTYTVQGKFYDGKNFSKAGTSTLVQ
jgi:hypothetical protein